MTRTATSEVDKLPSTPPLHTYCHLVCQSDSSPVSSPLSSGASSYSSTTPAPTAGRFAAAATATRFAAAAAATAAAGRKRKQHGKKKLKKKMDSEELQHVSDLSLSTESNNNNNIVLDIGNDIPKMVGAASPDSKDGGGRSSPLRHQLLQHHEDHHHHLHQQQQQQPQQQQRNAESHSRKSSSSSIRVEIPDIWGDESINFTTSTLRVCKEQVLQPYWGLLVFIGWRGIGKESVNSHLRRWRLLNVFYTSLIIMLLFYTYMYEILACEWKLDIHGGNHKHPTIAPPTGQPVNTTQTETPASTPLTSQVHIFWDSLAHHGEVGNNNNPNNDANNNNNNNQLLPKRHHRHIHHHNTSDTNLMDGHNEGCHHIITTYLIPNLLHLLAYCLGLYYFRSQENEQLYALMEKVFLQATPHQARTASQHKMIIKLRIMLIIGSIWVFLTVFIQVLYIWAFDFPEMPLYTKIGQCGYWIMLIMELLGRTVFNSVILAIVMNYVTQCEMIKFYVQGLTTRLLEKSTDLKAAMKDLLTIRHSVSLLNGVISKMTSLVTFIVAELSIIGLCILIMNDIDSEKVWVYRSLFPFVWMVMLVLPLWQAARVNSIILRVQKISLEMRVFGYKGASIIDLDSFLQFVTLIRPKAKLFHLPMLPAYLISAVVLAAFILLILIQTGSVAIMDFVF